ncbi:MAG: NUDIX hydrolase [Hyphomonas sp.]|nr:NUDIX hydrolase [Hyphomonas sp.]
MKPWTILSSKQVMRDQFMGLRTDRCQREDGHIVESYHVTELTDWVTVVPVTDEGNIVLIREYRHAAGVVMIGLPGGVSDPGESDWAAVGVRELREETGYTARELHHIGACHPNPATQNNTLHYFLALGCRADAAQSLDPNEEIEVLEMPYADFLDYGALPVQHALHAAALFYAERFFLTHPDLRPAKGPIP